MSVKATVTVTTEVELDASIVAKWFCALNDEEQADVFIAIERESRNWPNDPNGQWWYVMNHLKTCECSNEATRQMILTWADYVKPEEAT